MSLTPLVTFKSWRLPNKAKQDIRKGSEPTKQYRTGRR